MAQTAFLALLGLLCAVPTGRAVAQGTDQLYQVQNTTYGCSNPRAALALTNPLEARRGDPRWVAFVVSDGHCVVITPSSQWRLLFRDGALAFVTYAGTTRLPGSFYVRAAELVLQTPAQPAPDADQAIAQPVQRDPEPSEPTPQSAAPEIGNAAPDVVPSPQVGPARTGPTARPASPARALPVPPAPTPATMGPALETPVPAPPAQANRDTGDGRGAGAAAALVIVLACALRWMRQGRRRPRDNHAAS